MGEVCSVVVKPLLVITAVGAVSSWFRSRRGTLIYIYFFSGYETFAATGVYSAPFIFLFPNSAKSDESSFLPN